MIISSLHFTGNPGYQCRMETNCTFEDLFYACCEEVADIFFMEALYRILALSLSKK